MSDIGPIFGPLHIAMLAPIFGPLHIAMLAPIIGAPGLVLGAAVASFALRRHRSSGAVVGATVRLLWLAGFALWKASP